MIRNGSSCGKKRKACDLLYSGRASLLRNRQAFYIAENSSNGAGVAAIWKIAATRKQRTQKQRDKVPQSFQLSLPRCCFNRQRGLFLFTCIRCQPAIRGGGVGNIGQKGCSSNAGSKFVQVALELTTPSIQAKGGP